MSPPSLGALIELMPDAMLVVAADGLIVSANRQAAALTGYALTELIGLAIDRLVPDGVRHQHQALRDSYMASPRIRPMGARGDLRLRHRDGREIPVDIRLGHLEADGETLAVAAVRDRTLAREAEQRLRESEERFRSLTALSSDWYWEQDEQFRFTFFSETSPTRPGLESEDVEFGFTPFSRTKTQQASFDMQTMLGKTRFELPLEFESENARKEHLRTLQAHRPFYDLLMKHPQTGRWVCVSGEPKRNADGKFSGYRGVTHDVTDRRRAEEHARFLATRDPLTGLPNRALLHDRLQMALYEASRNGRRVAALFIDLDRFKAINDTLGHDVGDRFLREVAQRLSGLFRKGDTLARLGGDEFVMVLEDLRVARDAEPVATKVVAAIAEPFVCGANTFLSGASVGVAVFPEDGSDPATLLRHADTAMYRAKHEGRGRFRFFYEDNGRAHAQPVEPQSEPARAIANR